MFFKQNDPFQDVLCCIIFLATFNMTTSTLFIFFSGIVPQGEGGGLAVSR